MESRQKEFVTYNTNLFKDKRHMSATTILSIFLLGTVIAGSIIYIFFFCSIAKSM